MNHHLIVWLHDEATTQPNLILVEYDSEGGGPRMIEIYRSGEVVLKTPVPGRASVVSGRYPPPPEDTDGDECFVFGIGKSDFERYFLSVSRHEAV